MSRRRASITVADIARAIRAAKQAGAAEVEFEVEGGSRITIRIHPGAQNNAETTDKIIL
jgi:hypothetical protein